METDAMVGVVEDGWRGVCSCSRPVRLTQASRHASVWPKQITHFSRYAISDRRLASGEPRNVSPNTSSALQLALLAALRPGCLGSGECKVFARLAAQS